MRLIQLYLAFAHRAQRKVTDSSSNEIGKNLLSRAYFGNISTRCLIEGQWSSSLPSYQRLVCELSVMPLPLEEEEEEEFCRACIHGYFRSHATWESCRNSLLMIMSSALPRSRLILRTSDAAHLCVFSLCAMRYSKPCGRN